MRTGSRAWPLAVLAAALAGCAGFNPWLRPEPGMSREQVVAALGRPTQTVALAGGGTRLQYSQQPQGQYATMVDLDASGRVVRAEQVLDEAHFSAVEIDRWTRADVERAFGPPGRIDHVASWHGDLWQYRWRQGLNDMYWWAYFDRAGILRRASWGAQYEDAPGQQDGPGLP